MMIDKVVLVIGLCHYRDVVRRVAKIWRDMCSLM
jgi:hypothetical protein